MLLALLISQSALAQDRVVVDRYTELKTAFEQAEARYQTDASSENAAAFEAATVAFKSFVRTNEAVLEPYFEAEAAQARLRAEPAAAKDRGRVAVPQATTYSSTDVPLAIPDGPGGMVSSTLTITDVASIEDVDVTLDITHPFDADLEISIESPLGTIVELTSDNGGSGDNYTDTTFDDEAPIAIDGLGSGDAPFTGSFQPEGLLSDFDGESITGTWTLHVVDDATLDIGILNSWSVTIESSADLSLDKDCQINPDGTGTYFLTLRNDGGLGTGIEVQDDLPGGISGVVADASQGTFNPITGLWTVGALATGESATLEIDYTFDPSVAGDYSNQAEVVALDQDDTDSVPGDGMGDDYAECGAMFSPNPIDLSLQKDCNANDDGTGLYFLTLSNDGPGDATGIQVQDWLPDLLSNVDGDESQGGFNPITGLWTVGDLAAGNTATLQIDFTFDPDVDAEYLNQAEVVAVNEGDADSTPDDGEGDDYDECLFIVNADHGAPEVDPGSGGGGSADQSTRFEADLRVTKTVDVENASAASNVEYTLRVTDAGPHSTSNVSVEDVLPACLTFVSAEADRGSYDAATGLWTVGSVKVGETLTMTLVAEVGSSCTGTVTNTASVASTSLPDPPRLPDAPNSPVNDPFEIPATILNNTASAAFDVSTGRVLDGTGFALGENYPNPFNPTTVVPYSLAEASHVSIKVYDMLGREVAVLVEGRLSAGTHEVTFEAGSLPTGVYLIRMEAGGFVAIQRVTLMK